MKRRVITYFIGAKKYSFVVNISCWTYICLKYESYTQEFLKDEKHHLFRF